MAPPQTPFTAKYDGELEGARAREFYKYYGSYDNMMKTSNEKVNSSPDGTMCSFDGALAAFAQFVCLRLNVRRCLISCFDRDYQYILAEATRTLSLESHTSEHEQDRLWLGAGILERQSMLCERTLELAERKNYEGHDRVVVFPNIAQDDWYKSCQPPVRMPDHVCFYAGTAIRSPVGPVIGVISIMDETPRDTLSDGDRNFLQFMADTVMAHLDMVRSKEEHSRTSQMVIGLGSYVEGKARVDESLHNHTISAAHDLDPDKPSSGTPRLAVSDPSVIAVPGPTSSYPTQDVGKRPPSPASSDNLQNSMLSTDVKSTFHRAACIIKDAIDVDSVVFLDASVSSYGGLVQSVPAQKEDDINSYFAHSAASQKECHMLACVGQLKSGVHMTENFLHSLFTRYAPGRIFNIDPEETALSMTNPKSPRETEDFKQQVEPQEEQHSDDETREEVRKQREQDINDLRRIFPEARSLAFVPMWDDHRMRWFAGCIAVSNREIRPLHKDSELSFLRVFGISIMSEVAKLDSAMADKVKADLLNSISHELRSPLHGILGSIECLEPTILDPLQRGLVETVEICGRTLLDTIEHLLDFSKINNFTRNKAKLQQLDPETKKVSMLSLDAQIHLPTIIEEALETVYAGHSSYVPARTHSVSDNTLPKQDVQIIVDIEAKEYGDWLINTESGSWRRLVMNLAGNSLKYTKDGYIHISLQAQDLPGNSDGLGRSRIVLTVKDTGRGMSREFLENHLFRPFTQEDPLQSGAGLGLSMVQHIVHNLGGEVSVESKLNEGTEVRVEIVMLKSTTPAVENEAVTALLAAMYELQGSKAVFIDPPTTPTGESPAQRSIRKVLDKQSWGWYKMDFETVRSVQEVKNADFVITTRGNLSDMKQRLIGIGKPTVVLCENNLEIREAYAEAETFRRAVGTNFIAKPFGPRKLASALMSCKKQRGQIFENNSIQRDTDTASRPIVPQHDEQYRNRDPVPLHGKAPTTDHAMQQNTKAVDSSSAGAEPDTPKSLRLLLVDDNKINLQLLVRYCKSRNHDYTTAEDGVEAVEAFCQHQKDAATKFDFVCMDISMPRMDGLEATRHIRSFEHTNGLTASRVIALTGLASAEAQQEAFSSGVDQFMTKPVRLRELGEVLSGARR